MRVLIVKLSSLGDVVHSLPAAMDLRAAHPGVAIDWVIEPGFAPLLRHCPAVDRVIPMALRRWRKRWWTADTRSEWRRFKIDLQAQAYDAVVDLQGLGKSAWVSRLARLTPGGRRMAMGNRTEGSSYEAPTRWVADVVISLPARIHAVARARRMCALALGYPVPETSAPPALVPPAWRGPEAGAVCFVHGTSRADKTWPDELWIGLGRRLVACGHRVVLPQADALEAGRAARIAAALGPSATVWPALTLDALLPRLAACAAVVGVDSGLSHMAVALGLPHVQLYNFDTGWRTGPPAPGEPGAVPHQRVVFGQPHPALESVWTAWEACGMAPPPGDGG